MDVRIQILMKHILLFHQIKNLEDSNLKILDTGLSLTHRGQIGLKQITHKNQKIMVSSASRTFLDCIERPEYSGDWEECLKSLESLAGVKANELKQLLDEIGKDMLFRKTGFILDLFNENPYYEGILSSLQSYLTEKMGKSPMYLKEGTKSELEKKWRLYVPIGFKDVIRGV